MTVAEAAPQVACSEPNCRLTHPELDPDGTIGDVYSYAWVFAHLGETAINHTPGNEGAYAYLRWALAEVERLTARVAELGGAA